MNRELSKYEKAFAGMFGIAEWTVLAIQLILYIMSPGTPGVSLIEKLTRFFSYFTTITNMLVAVTLTAIVFFPYTVAGRMFSRASFQTAVTSYISVVGLVYSLFLRGALNPTGWQAIADHFLHDAAPVFFFFYWLVSVPKQGLEWIDPLKWMIFPCLYVLYSIGHGSFSGWYPYWFANVGQLGYPVALRNSFLILLAFYLVGSIYICISKLMVVRAVRAST
jgi:hypothetical protein